MSVVFAQQSKILCLSLKAPWDALAALERGPATPPANTVVCSVDTNGLEGRAAYTDECPLLKQEQKSR